MTEAELSKLIRDLAHSLGWEVFALPANRTVRPVKDAVGYPDLTLARRHQVMFMELKTDTGKVSDDQWRWGIALPEWHVIRPADWNDGRVAGMLEDNRRGHVWGCALPEDHQGECWCESGTDDD